MRLSDVLWNQLKGQKMISITGSGGKTTLMCLLARRFQEEGHSVLVSTTTKLASPDCYPYPVQKVFLEDAVFSYYPRTGEGVFYAKSIAPGKVASPGSDALMRLSHRYEYLIVEADGSRRLPLKYHTSRDPVVLESSFAVAVMGLSSLGKPIASVCFGCERKGVVDVPFLQWLIEEKQGALKGGARMLVLNQAEGLELPLDLHAPVPMLYASEESDLLLMHV